MNLKLKVFHCIFATFLLMGLALPSAQPVYSQAEGDQTLLSDSLNINPAHAESNDGALSYYLAANFAGSGLYVYGYSSATWTQVSPITPENFVYAGTTLYGDFGIYGLYSYNGSAWTQLATANPENIVISGSTVYGDFGVYGLYSYNGATWTQIAATNPENLLVSGSNLYVDFGASGLWRWYGSMWTKLATANPENMIIVNATLIGDFGTSGIYYWTGTGSVWTKIATANSEQMIVGHYLTGDFGASGVYFWNYSAWIQITADNPENMVGTDSPTYGTYFDFGASGIWRYNNDWTKIAAANPENLLLLNLAVLIGDFGASGVYKYEGVAWTQLTPANPLRMASSL